MGKNSKAIYLKWCVYKNDPEPTSCILALPGRGQSGFHMAGTYHSLTNPKTLVIGVTPLHYEWYPQPEGPENQTAALGGLRKAILTIDRIVNFIIGKYNIPAEKISIVGYSAGGVMAILAAAYLIHHKFASVTCHAGAILHPPSLPQCANNETEFLVCHSFDDFTFDWWERHIPSKQALLRKGYNVQFSERDEGGHSIFYDDLKHSLEIMERKFAV